MTRRGVEYGGWNDSRRHSSSDPVYCSRTTSLGLCMDVIFDLGKRMAKGALWSVLMRFAVRSIGIVSTIVLARLLVPADFGLVVLATMLIAFLEVLSQLEFSTFLIVGRGVDRSYYDTAWTLSLLRGGLTSILLVISASFAADFREPRLQNVIYALALVCVIDGLAMSASSNSTNR
jgi:O-antigen/teichoic acid export membrane protein